MDSKTYDQMRADAYNNEPGRLNERDGYNCKKCKNKGFIAYIDDRGEERSRYCECLEIRKMIESMRSCGLSGAEFEKYRFDNFDSREDWQNRIKESALSFVREQERPLQNGGERSWWYIGGNPGAGKSHISTAIVKQLMKQGKGLLYLCWPAEMSRLNALVGGDSPDRRKKEGLLKQYKTVDVLYIDDLFKTGCGQDGRRTRPTAAEIRTAFEIINARYAEPERMTVFSSEWTLDELLKIDEASASRIIERTDERYRINISRSMDKNHRLKK